MRVVIWIRTRMINGVTICCNNNMYAYRYAQRKINHLSFNYNKVYREVILKDKISC
jgi:hypothetical protein